MAQTIEPGPSGDTKKVIEDKVRALPANQGLNEVDMLDRIDAEVKEARKAKTLNDNEQDQTRN